MNFHTKAVNKAYDIFLDICKHENIEYEEADNIVMSIDGNLCSGLYHFTQSEITGKYHTDKSKITVVKDKMKNMMLLTFVHELGHHFAIKKEADRSEKRADEIRKELFLKKLPLWCRWCLFIEISIL